MKDCQPGRHLSGSLNLALPRHMEPGLEAILVDLKNACSCTLATSALPDMGVTSRPIEDQVHSDSNVALVCSGITFSSAVCYLAS